MMEIKYCKNCMNFTPIFRRTGLKPEEDYSWGYCRVLSKLELKDKRIVLVAKNQAENIIEKSVATNQVIMIDDHKICPAYSNLSDLFKTEISNLDVNNIDILKELWYVKCRNCFHIFASDQKEISDSNEYTCPICYHRDLFRYDEHFRKAPRFITDEAL